MSLPANDIRDEVIIIAEDIATSIEAFADAGDEITKEAHDVDGRGVIEARIDGNTYRITVELLI